MYTTIGTYYSVQMTVCCPGWIVPNQPGQQSNNPKLIYKLRKDKFRIVGLQAQINYVRCVLVLLLYVYFVVTSTVLVVVVCFLFNWM